MLIQSESETSPAKTNTLPRLLCVAALILSTHTAQAASTKGDISTGTYWSNDECPNGGYHETIFWSETTCPKSFTDTRFHHTHGVVNHKLAVRDSDVWAVFDDNAFVYQTSNVGLRVEQNSSDAAGLSQGFLNDAIFRNALGVPNKDPFDPDTFVANDAGSNCGGSASGSYTTNYWDQLLDPRSGMLYPSDTANDFGCSPKWIRQSKDPDIAAVAEFGGVMYVTWVERYFDNPDSTTLSSGSVPNGMGADRWDEWKVFVAEYDPDSSGEPLTLLAGGGVGGSLNLYSGLSELRHARSPRIAVDGESLWVAWVEEYAPGLSTVHVAEYLTGGTWDHKGGVLGIGLLQACTTKVFPGAATAGKDWVGHPTGTNPTEYGSYRVGNVGYALDIGMVDVGADKVPMVVTSNADPSTGECEIISRVYEPSTDSFVGAGNSAGEVAQTIAGDIFDEFFTPRIATSGGEAYVTFINAPHPSDPEDLVVGPVFVFAIDMDDTTPTWRQIKKEYVNGSIQNTWDTNVFPSIAIQQDFQSSSHVGTRLSVMTDFRRRDAYVLPGRTSNGYYSYLSGLGVTTEGTSAQGTSNFANLSLSTDVIITSADQSGTQDYEWDVATGDVQQGDDHRPSDSWLGVRVDGFADPDQTN